MLRRAHDDTVASGHVFLGEPAKWVPVAAARVAALEWTMESADRSIAAQTSVTVRGAAGEQIELAFAFASASASAAASAAASEVSAIQCTLSAAGTATARFPDGTCA